MFDSAYVVMDRLPGATLNELTYRRPEVIEKNMVTISYQLGMHMAFSYIFGAKDGYQTNYVFDPVSKLLTRIDKESFLEVPNNPTSTLSDGDDYTQEIAACELTNLKYIPSFREPATRPKVLYAFKQGFLDKYSDIKSKKDDLLTMVQETRGAWAKMKPPEDEQEYAQITSQIKDAVQHLITQESELVFQRLVAAKKEVDEGKYKKR